MSITRSYNKHTNTYYAYETTYVWDEKAQKKIQRKQCIGKIDPKTDQIIPTGKRGRPRKTDIELTSNNSSENSKYAKIVLDIETFSDRLHKLETSFDKLSSEFVQMNEDLESILSRIHSLN